MFFKLYDSYLCCYKIYTIIFIFNYLYHDIVLNTMKLMFYIIEKVLYKLRVVFSEWIRFKFKEIT